MADVFEPAKRSEIMSKIRSRNTKAERLVFSYLRKENIYFQRHYSRVPGKPDIALPRKKRAVFIDGDFWHGRNPERVRKLPTDYWRPKILSNLKRDSVINESLAAQGWKVLRVWEKDILKKQERDKHLSSIKTFLTD